MSLSGWLKAYVYNPLLITLMRRAHPQGLEPFLAVIAFFTTFFLVGAWHGQTSEFLFFGVLQGGGVSFNKLYQILLTQRIGKRGYRTVAANRLYAAICRRAHLRFVRLHAVLVLVDLGAVATASPGSWGRDPRSWALCRAAAAAA